MCAGEEASQGLAPTAFRQWYTETCACRCTRRVCKGLHGCLLRSLRLARLMWSSSSRCLCVKLSVNIVAWLRTTQRA